MRHRHMNGVAVQTVTLLNALDAALHERWNTYCRPKLRASTVRDPARFKNVVHEYRKPIDIRKHHLPQTFALFIREFLARQRIETQLDRRERALEFMRDRIDKRLLTTNFK